MTDTSKIIAGGGWRRPLRTVRIKIKAAVALACAITAFVLFLNFAEPLALAAGCAFLLIAVVLLVMERPVEIPGPPDGGRDPRNLHSSRSSSHEPDGSVDLYDWSQVHSQILSETFDSLDFDRAVALVGVLSMFRTWYSDELQAVVEPVEKLAPANAMVLTPEESSRLVGDLFGWDAADLLREWRWRWVRLKSSPLVDVLLADLATHRFVGRLSPTPVL